MYQKHFGLKSRPFGAKAEGAGVFVGPQQNKVITKLNKAFAALDAVATITGPVGVGKTTIVRRALDSIAPGRTVAWIGRLQLAPDEVLELLLAGCGVRRQIKGTIQRFATFRRLLRERTAAGGGITIVVEDARCIGSDTLAALETLTAADTGDDAGANIVLMGPPDLHDLLSSPDLARMNQRNRLRQHVQAFSLPEVRGYLKHSFRQAGGDCDQIIDEGIAEIVFDCAEGIPRIINNLCETALIAAAEDDIQRITPALMRQVAYDTFGYQSDSVGVNAATQISQKKEVEPLAEATAPSAANENIDWKATPNAEVGSQPGQAHDVAIEPGCQPASSESASPEPAGEPDDFDADNIPHLINDTQPEIPTLYSEETDNPVPETDSVDEVKFDLTAALLPENDATNVMPGLSPRRDSAALDVPQAEVQDSGKKAESTLTLESIVAPDPGPGTPSSTAPAAREITDDEDMLQTTHNWTEDGPVVEFDLPTIPEPKPATMGSGPDPFRESVAMRIDMLHAIKNRSGEEKNSKYKSTTPRPAAELSKRTRLQTESVEQLIKPSLAQTDEAIDSASDPEFQIEEKKKKTGRLLSRFKKSS